MGSKYFLFIIAGAIVFIVISIFAASCKSGGAIMSPAADEPGGESANPYVAAAEPMPPEVFTGELSPVGAAMEHPKTLVAADKSPLGLSIAVIESEGSLRAENIKLTQTRTAQGYIAEISAVNAKDVTQALFEVRFDTARFHVSGWRIGEFLAADSRAELTDGGGVRESLTDGGGDYSESVGGAGKLEKVEGGASVVKAAGALCALIAAADHAGVAVARINPDVRGAASGGGAVCTLEFSHGPAVFHSDSGGTELTGSQSANSQSGGASSAAANRGASAETGGGFWDWKYGTIMPYGKRGDNGSLVIANGRFPGDADRNYEVSIADITPIAQQYEKTIIWHSDLIADGVSPFKVAESPNELIANADLDRNGEVGISDITVIANNYNRLYYPRGLARRESPEGTWMLVSQLSDSVSDDVTQRQDLHIRGRAKMNSFALDDVYGIPFVNQTTGEIDVLPIVRQEFEGFVWDNYFGTITADDVLLQSGDIERRLIAEFDLLGDYDLSRIVNISDVSMMAVLYGELSDGNFNRFALPYLHGFIREYESWGYDLGYSVNALSHLLPISANYSLMSDTLEIAYYDSAEAETPVFAQDVDMDKFSTHYQWATWIYPDRKVIAVPAPPVYGTLFVEAVMVLSDGTRIEKPGRHEVYFPPPEVE